jgi:hypothetical protein
MRVAVAIELTEQERQTLTKYSRGRNTPAKVVLRAKVILRAAGGLQNKVIAAELETDRGSSPVGERGLSLID